MSCDAGGEHKELEHYGKGSSYVLWSYIHIWLNKKEEVILEQILLILLIIKLHLTASASILILSIMIIKEEIVTLTLTDMILSTKKKR